MKNFPRVQKIGILSSRVLESSRLPNISDNFQLMVDKQLQDDFKVHQYLNQNPNEGHNTEEYISLLNTMLVKKFNKVKRKQFIWNRKNQCLSPDKMINSRSNISLQKSCVKEQNGDTYYTQQEYIAIKQESEAQQVIIQAKTKQQLEMKKILLREITENKKSLNLLKGDIGHMITRNQSISILQSKVNKVSLVSQNQLKRVSMALSKDKEEVLLRQNMQKKFNSKLKMIQSLQSKNLSKIKASYIQTMNRRKQIFDNLSLMQKRCTSSEEYSDKSKQKQQINIKTISTFKLLKFICSAIEQSKQLAEKYIQEPIQLGKYSQKLKKIYNNEQQMYNKGQNLTIDDFNEESLYQIIRIIITDYQRLQNLIQQKKKICRQHMEKIEQFWYKIGNHTRQLQTLWEQFNIQQRNQLKYQKFSHQEYFKKFHELKRNFNILNLLINFFNKKVGGPTDGALVTQIYHNESYHLKIQGENQETQKNFNQFILEEIQTKFKNWFSIIINGGQLFYKIPVQSKEHLISQYNKSFCIIKNKAQNFQQINTKHKQMNQYGEIVRTSSQIQQNQNKKQFSEFIFQKENVVESKVASSFHKLDYDDQTAKRIQALEKIDQNYYRMIKETIKMQKQNTMKNYQFQKNFKRNKYSSQDEVLQQKRFQASFSNLFKQDPGETPKQLKSPMNSTSFSRFRGKQLQKKLNITKATFSSLHNRKYSSVASKSQLFEKPINKRSLWEKQNKIRLRKKLKDVLNEY